MATFDEAFILIVGSEGNYANNPADPGGETKFGVSKRAYPAEDIPGLTIERAKQIYREDYWDKIAGDNLPPPLALIVMDGAINNGPSRAAKWLQLAAGAAQDGIIGPATLGAVARHQLADIIVEFQAQRALFMLTLPTVGTFGLGWSRRLFHVTLASLAFERRPSPPPATPALVTVDPAAIEAIEVAVRKALDTLNQRVQP